jgi:hypothetical protein
MARSIHLVGSLIASAVIASTAAPLTAQACATGTRASLVFDGVNDYVKIPHNPAIDGFTNFTLEVWFKAAPTGPLYRTLIDKGGENHYLLGVFQQAATHIEGTLVFENGPNVLNNTWRHLALTGAGSNLVFYLDGIVIAAGTYNAPLGTVTDNLHLGAFLGPLQYHDHWNGAIDEVRIWNVTRSQAQINANRLYVLSGSEPGLMAYYRFDNTSGQIVVNSATATGAALDGTLGPDAIPTAEDPFFSTADYPPMYYCVSNPGQANSALARLEINGAGAGTVPGPFPVSVPGGTSLTFSWAGPVNMPYALALGPLNVNNANLGCVGLVDIGTPPFYGDLFFFMDGLALPGSLLYVLSASGTSSQVFTVPQAAAGLSFTCQGVVFQPFGCPVVLTSAFTVSVP